MTLFQIVVLRATPSLEKLAHLCLSISDSSNCFRIALVIVALFAEVGFLRRSLAARNLVFALPVVGFTNLMNVISCSLLAT